MFDEEMHIYSPFAKQLAAALTAENDGLVNLDGQIDLEYYKLVKTSIPSRRRKKATPPSRAMLAPRPKRNSTASPASWKR